MAKKKAAKKATKKAAKKTTKKATKKKKKQFLKKRYALKTLGVKTKGFFIFRALFFYFYKA